MKNWKAAVCDDEILLLPQLAAVIKNAFRRRDLSVDLDTYSSAPELLGQIFDGNAYDIYFLDIDLPDQNGITLAKKSGQSPRRPPFSLCPQRKSKSTRLSRPSLWPLYASPASGRTWSRLWMCWPSG